VKYLVSFVLGHRIIPKAESHLRGQTAEELLKGIVDSVLVPVEDEVGTEAG
jgi:hypothetical protein